MSNQRLFINFPDMIPELLKIKVHQKLFYNDIFKVKLSAAFDVTVDTTKINLKSPISVTMAEGFYSYYTIHY